MSSKNDELRTRLLATFQVEAEEHIQVLTANLLALGKEVSPSEAHKIIEVSFREMHTLKGAARSVGLVEVETLCQACEAVFSKLFRGDLALSPSILKMLHDVVEQVPTLLTGNASSAATKELVGRLKATITVPVSEVTKPIESPAPHVRAPIVAAATQPSPSNIIRLNTTKLDMLFLQAEELLLFKQATEMRVREARELLDTVTRCRTSLAHRRFSPPSLPETRRPATLDADPESAVQTIEARTRVLLDQIAHDHRTITSAANGLQENLRLLRMAPASTMLSLFPGMVRSLADELGKQVEWVVRGDDLEVDRKVLEAMKDPLIHLVRNAVDHGIEPPNVRTKAGKPAQGRVALTVTSLEGNRIEIRIEDDGRGVDLAQVRAAAVRGRHLTSDEAQALTDEEALDLIYRSGISTMPLISDVSGHGLGLPIVRERVEQLDGHIRVETSQARGTTVRITLSVTVATFRGLLVRAGGQLYLFPTEAVAQTLRIPLNDEPASEEGRSMIQWRGSPLPFAQLAELLGLPSKKNRLESYRKQSCVVMRIRETHVGLGVEEVLGEQEVVVKQLGPPLIRVRNVASAGLLGTGQIVLILRAADLLRTIRDRPRSPRALTVEENEQGQPVILVVDDSITTRTMEKNLLETTGYHVRVAVDGIEAWTLLKHERVDLVVSDVDMPRMNGLDLTAKIRADRDLANLPVILVTALESREDKERGLEVGANAYLVKSSFDQSKLLEFIRRHL